MEIKLKRYDKWQRYLDRYGIWTLVLLRTIPIVPSNVINFMAAVSPIKASSYIWGTVLGNLSFIWLFGTIGSSLVVPREEWNGFLAWYAVLLLFCWVSLSGGIGAICRRISGAGCSDSFRNYGHERFSRYFAP